MFSTPAQMVKRLVDKRKVPATLKVRDALSYTDGDKPWRPDAHTPEEYDIFALLLPLSYVNSERRRFKFEDTTQEGAQLVFILPSDLPETVIPRVGDSIEFEDSTEWRILTVDPLADVSGIAYYEITVRA